MNDDTKPTCTRRERSEESSMAWQREHGEVLDLRRQVRAAERALLVHQEQAKITVRELEAAKTRVRELEQELTIMRTGLGYELPTDRAERLRHLQARAVVRDELSVAVELERIMIEEERYAKDKSETKIPRSATLVERLSNEE